MLPKLTALTVLLAIGILLGVGTSSAQETGSTETTETENDITTIARPPADMPFAKFRAKRIELRQKAKSIKLSKCRAPVHPFYKQHREIKPWLRDESLAHWRRHVERARAQSSKCVPWTPYYERGILCIHKYEGAWDSNTGNGYYGGLQMDLAFQQAHGPDFLKKYGSYYTPSAHRWSIYEQMLVGWRAYSGTGPGSYGPRGFGPWPNTRLKCGV